MGAHVAEEKGDYDRSFPGVPVWWVEANRDKIHFLNETLRGKERHMVIEAVVGDEDGAEVIFHHANNGQSSSILEFGTHSESHPEVEYVATEERRTDRLDTLMDANGVGEEVNFANFDIQGAELLALKGMGDRLNQIDYIYTEVNAEKVYEECALMEELDEFLSDFDRVMTRMTPFRWGDAFYVRRDKLPQ